MLLVLLTAGLATVLLYFYLTWNHNYWHKQNIPYVKPSSLIFGNVKELIFRKKNMGTLYDEFYRKYSDSHLVGFFKLRQPALVIKDPELIKSILVKEFNSFHDPDFDCNKHIDPVLAANPFLEKGHRWKTVRSALSPNFTSARLRAALPHIARACENLIEHLETANWTAAQGIEVHKFVMRFTTDAVFSSAFGIEANALLDPQSKIWQMVSTSFGVHFNRSWLASFMMPAIAYIFKLRMFTEDFSAFFAAILKQSVQHREQGVVKRTDYLQLLLDMMNDTEKDENNSKVKINTFNDVSLYSHVLYIEGVATTAQPIMLTLYELALHPEMQQRLRDEIDSNLADITDLTDLSKINNLTYLEMIISETLRKYPPLFALTRRCTQRITLPVNGGKCCVVQPGTLVSIPVYSIHYDPKNYPDPGRFDPERFTEQAKAARHKFTYLPFGEGPRVCIGMRFSMCQVKLALITLVRNFEILPTERTKKHLSYDEANMLFLSITDEIWLRFKRIVK